MTRREELINDFYVACDGWGYMDDTIDRKRAFDLIIPIVLSREQKMLEEIEKPLKEWKEWTYAVTPHEKLIDHILSIIQSYKEE